MYVLRTLGALDLRAADNAVIQSVLGQPKRAALLCYLAAGPAGIHTRDTLIGMFWSELDHEHARNALSQAVHFLRRSLGSDAILQRNSDDLTLNSERVSCDVVELERLLERGSLERALTLYQGDFLQGFYVSDAPAFEHWIDEKRTRLREHVASAAEQLAHSARTAGDRAAAIEWARRCCAWAPYDEQRARVLLELLAEAGQASAAITFYESFAARLWQDLELKPTPQSQAIVQNIRARSRAAAESVPTPPNAQQPAARPAAKTQTGELESLHDALAPELDVLRLLGRGTTAIAYLAREPALKRLVAVKVLRRQLAADIIARLRFEREAQAAARISHTHVATVYRVGRLPDEVPYIVMEYVDGRTLADTLAARGPLQPDEARSLMHALASALTAAHQQGVIHRDVQPGNIFLESRSGRVVLIDFGIAALLESGSDGNNPLTPAGTRLGEVRYISPELARGEPVSEFSDVYSLGIVVFEALTGKHPVDTGALEIEAGLTTGARLTVDPPGRAGDLLQIVERCLSANPNRRPRAQDVAAMLSSIR